MPLCAHMNDGLVSWLAVDSSRQKLTNNWENGGEEHLATQNCSRVGELMICYLQSEPESEYTEHNVPFSRNLCFCYLLKSNTLICTKANQAPQPVW